MHAVSSRHVLAEPSDPDLHVDPAGFAAASAADARAMRRLLQDFACLASLPWRAARAVWRAVAARVR